MRTGHLVLLRSCAFGILVITAFFDFARVAAQAPGTAQPQSASDAGAVTALTNALNAMGGAAAWAQVGDATVTGSCTGPQGQDETAQTSEPFQWVTQGTEFRYQSGAPGQLSVLLSGHGAPSSVTPTGTSSLNSESYSLLKPFHLPGQVLAAILNDPNYIASMVAQTDASDGATLHIRVRRRLIHAFESGSEQDWWLNSSTFLPVSVTYSVPGQTIRSYMAETYTFSAWSTQGYGALVPLQITLSTNLGIPPETCTAAQVQFNTNPAATLFNAE